MGVYHRDFAEKPLLLSDVLNKSASQDNVHPSNSTCLRTFVQPLGEDETLTVYCCDETPGPDRWVWKVPQFR